MEGSRSGATEARSERLLPLEAIGERYARLRLPCAEAEGAMYRSLERYGQIAPVVVCERAGRYELLDGFKRLSAARRLATLPALRAYALEVDERGAKAALYALNRHGRMQELEEAWIVSALVREEGLSQLEVAELLGRHKSWVCRRLALLEKLAPEARDELRLGLLSVTAARQLIRLPLGNQSALVEVIHREALSAGELQALVDLWLGSPGGNPPRGLLQQPRALLAPSGPMRPRAATGEALSAAARAVAQKLRLVLKLIQGMEHTLRFASERSLTLNDRALLAGRMLRLSHHATALATLSEALAVGRALP
jgi:ParB-like chromosome segregation protein Spo0J